MVNRTACVFVLSTKSAGSSVLQKTIAARTGARLAASTRHLENETLYWTKAASALGLQQIRLPMSEVPIPKRRATRELRAFVAANTGGHRLDDISRDAIFEAFAAVCHEAGPIFLEKSPHHLYQQAAIELMEDFSDRVPSVEVVFLGLIRNPLDTLFSSWRRFGLPPATEEPFWRTAYENLQALSARRPGQVHILRYEELVDPAFDLDGLLARIGLEAMQHSTPPVIHQRSLGKWRSDPFLGHQLDPATVRLAMSFGYSADMLTGRARPWRMRDRLRHAAYAAYRVMPEQMRRTISSLRR